MIVRIDKDTNAHIIDSVNSRDDYIPSDGEKYTINIKDYVGEMLSLNFLELLLDDSNLNNTEYYNELNFHKLNNSKAIKFFRKQIMYPAFQLIFLNNLILLISRTDILTCDSNTVAENELYKITDKRFVYSEKKADFISTYNYRFRSVIHMLYSEIESDFTSNMSDDDFISYMEKGVPFKFSFDHHLLKTYDEINGFEDFLEKNLNISFSEFENIDNGKTKQCIKYLYNLLSIEFPFKKLNLTEPDESFKSFKLKDFDGLGVRNRFEMFDYIESCKKKYFAFEVYYFEQMAPESFLYFCMLYIKIHNIAKFKKCKICGRLVMDRDYCDNCYSYNEMFKEEKERIKRKLRKAKFDIKKQLDLNYRCKSDEKIKKFVSNFYNNLLLEIENIEIKYRYNYIRELVLEKNLSIIETVENNYSRVESYPEDFNSIKYVTKKLSDSNIENHSINKINEVSEFYKNYLTPCNFIKIITGEFKIDFEELEKILSVHIDLKKLSNYKDIKDYCNELLQ